MENSSGILERCEISSAHERAPGAASAPPGRHDRKKAGNHGGSALLLGNWRATVTAARQLSRLGYRVVLGSEPNAYYADASRFIDEVWHSPALAAGSAQFRDALLAFLDRTPDLSVIMPMHESALDTVAAMEAELKSRVRLAMPPARVIEICHDKYAWLRLARDAGVRCPPFGAASDLPQLATLAAQVCYPVVIRPTELGKRLGMRKAVTLLHDVDLRAAFPTWPEGVSELLVQRRFSGDRYNVYFAARSGQVLCEQHSKSLRTDRVDGTGQTVEGISIAPIAELTGELEKVVSRMSYTGIGNAQFLFDPANGGSCFLEINPRFGASYAFIEKAGLELTQLAVELADADMNPVVAAPRAFDEGTRFVSTFSDLAGLTYSLAKGEIGVGGAFRWLGAALRAAFRSDVHVTWSLNDPLPAIAVPVWRLTRSVAKGKSVLEPR